MEYFVMQSPEAQHGRRALQRVEPSRIDAVTQPSAEFLDLQAALAGEYSLQRELGRGGMGVVYLARDVQLDRDVAIKVLPTDLAQASSARERFLREARMAAGLSHPHIVPIHRVADMGGFVFFVMSYVEGETLGERLRTRGPLPPVDATRVLREVAWALAYAHGRGIVHRDVKPDNILLEARTGRALVTDFGIAHGGDDPGLTTDPGKITGTAHFMSPEQAAGAPIDGRSDIYALGVVGHLAVSGRLPFESQNLPALLLRQATEDAPSVMRAAPGLPPALAAAIDRCLARDPADRFTDGEELAEALAPPQTRPALPPTLRAWLAVRNPLLVPYMAWAGLFGTLATVNLAIWLMGQRPAGPADIALLAGIASLPIFPIVGFHINQAYRQFRAGHTLADLRSALAVDRRERAETEALARDEREPRGHTVLRTATIGSATWLAVTFGMLLTGVIHENRTSMLLLFAPVGTTMLLGAISNALDVSFIPEKISTWWKTGVRDRIWNSRAGEWLAKRLGAPERSQLSGASAFRATEAALGVAASELYAALPAAWRDQLADLPATVEALEARAAEARAELEMLNALAPSASAGAEVLAARRTAAAEHLTESVAALEGIRLDLLRLHAGAGDLAPLTTLMDAVRNANDEMRRLAEAQREVEDAAGRA
jgi:predicted Ser/Thr protein kinase